MTDLERVTVTRYVTPLREGGSLPGIVEADDLGTYVCKFRGAGQGLRVLIAEVVAAGIARVLGIPTPDQVMLDLDPAIARYEADEEVQDLLKASVGTNLGVDFLPGAFGWAPSIAVEPPSLAATILWFDAFIANVDRTFRNPNLLVWSRVPSLDDDLHVAVWAIDHGASLYFHHSWAGGVGDPQRFAAQPWSGTDHVFIESAPALRDADPLLSARLDDEALAGIVAAVPDEWLEPVPGAETPAALRAAYVEFLRARLSTRQWLPEAP